MKITWKQGTGLPTFVKGGGMGIVDGTPVYVAGMTHPWRETELSWCWNTISEDWFPVEPNLPLGRCYTSGATLEDGLLILGGRKTTDGSAQSLSDTWWLRRRNSQFHWTQLPNLTTPRAIPSIGICGNKILAFGGGAWEQSQGGAFASQHLTNYEILDLDNLSVGWQNKGKLPFTSLVGSAFASIGTSVYVFGGYECWTAENKRHLTRHGMAWHYDFSTDTWSRISDIPGIASGWCAAAYNGKVILLGGSVTLELSGVNVPYQTNHVLNPGTWRQRLIGAYSNLVFVYDIANNSYRMMPERTPVGLNDLCCTILGNTIYAAGGETSDPATSNTSDAFMIGTIEA